MFGQTALLIWPVSIIEIAIPQCSQQTPYSLGLQVRGEVHHDRRLHQLMLQEELRLYDASGAAAAPRAAPGARDGLSDSASSVHSDLAAAVAADMDDVPSDYRWALLPPLLSAAPLQVCGPELCGEVT